MKQIVEGTPLGKTASVRASSQTARKLPRIRGNPGIRSERLYGSGFAAPELDRSAAGSAMVLLLGGVVYIASRRREEALA